MKTRQILQDSVSVLIVAFSIFVLFFSGGVAGYVFKHNPFLFVSMLSAIAISICRLFRVNYKPRKAEKIVAVVYLCLTLLLFSSIWNLLLLSVLRSPSTVIHGT